MNKLTIVDFVQIKKKETAVIVTSPRYLTFFSWTQTIKKKKQCNTNYKLKACISEFRMFKAPNSNATLRRVQASEYPITVTNNKDAMSMVQNILTK